MKNQDYIVLRSHIGDKPYSAGDTRTANPNDVSHLLGKTIREKTDEDREAEATAELEGDKEPELEGGKDPELETKPAPKKKTSTAAKKAPAKKRGLFRAKK